MDAFFASVEQLTRGRHCGDVRSWSAEWADAAWWPVRATRHGSSAPARRCRCTRPAGLVGAAAVVLAPRGAAAWDGQSRRVLDTVRAMVPVLEQLSLDEVSGNLPELAGATAAEVEAFCAELRRRIRDETGLIASVGAGSGKQIAKIARTCQT